MIAVRLDRRLSARVDPSDVLQETMIQAHQKLPEYLRTQPIPFYPWLRRIAWENIVQLHRQHLLAQARAALYLQAARSEAARQSELSGHLMVVAPDPTWMAAAKYTVLNNAVEAVELALRVVGSVSLAHSNPLRRRYLDVRAGLNHPPQDDAALELLARRLVNEA